MALLTVARAEIETARDLLEAGEYTDAMRELRLAAGAGNAEAEELIGVMYALGLGVARDDRRAFEWYLRAAMKGHAGAQSGVGWYYEVGRRAAAPDLVRAYMWYALSASARPGRGNLARGSDQENERRANRGGARVNRRLPRLVVSVSV